MGQSAVNDSFQIKAASPRGELFVAPRKKNLANDKVCD